LHGLSRFDETPDRLLIEWQGGADYVVHGSTADVERQETRTAIVKVLPSTETEAATVKELILATGRKMTQAVVYEILPGLVTEGQAARKGAGKRGDPYRFWRPPDSSSAQAQEESQEETSEAPLDSSTTSARVQEETISPHSEAGTGDSSTTSNPRDSMFRKKRCGGGDGEPLRAKVFLLGREGGFRRHEYAPGLAILEGEAAWRKFAEGAAQEDLQLAMRSLLAQ
jgi:hypothetical protein